MITNIEAAELKYYNANSSGRSTGDCVKRAISFAFDIPYTQAAKLLNNKMKDLKFDSWQIYPVFKNVIRDLGGGESVDVKDTITVDEFADTNDPNYIYIVLVSEKPKGRTSHLLTIRNGKVWDSWDSRDYYVRYYWKINSSDRKLIQDRSKDTVNEMAYEYAEPVVGAEINRYISKKEMDVSYTSTTVWSYQYKIKIKCQVVFNKDELVKKGRTYNFDINLVIEPTWTDDEVIAFIKKMGKQRTYDKMWTIGEQEKKLRESAEMEKQLGEGINTLPPEWMTKQEQRFYNSLPGWCKPLVKDIYIQEPGKYPDSFVLRLRKLPGDDKHSGKNEFKFESWTANEMRNMLNEYKDTGRVEGIDYNYAEEY